MEMLHPLMCCLVELDDSLINPIEGITLRITVGLITCLILFSIITSHPIITSLWDDHGSMTCKWHYPHTTKTYIPN